MKWGDEMKESIEKMLREIEAILVDNEISIYFYGSVALNDFKLGWSDIDFLCLTKEPITRSQAEKLLYLRQNLKRTTPENLYYQSFEGAFLSLDTFLNKTNDVVVYWGTSGQKITHVYVLNSFSMMSLIDYGILVYGEDMRSNLKYPTENEIKKDIEFHLNTIRNVAIKTNRSLYSLGWLFDIARCIYTIRTGKIIAKTCALEWALDQQICPNIDLAQKALEIRKNPMLFDGQEKFMLWFESLGDDVQKFADRLEFELENKEV